MPALAPIERLSRATKSEFRDPQITRLKTSRPKWSVPSSPAGAGAASCRSRLCANGLCVASSGASTAAPTLARTMTSPTRAERCRSTRTISVARWRTGVAPCRTILLAEAMSLLRLGAHAESDARVDGGVEQIGDEVQDHDGCHEEVEDADDHRVVALRDARDEEAPDPRPAEHDLRDDRSPPQTHFIHHSHP